MQFLSFPAQYFKISQYSNIKCDLAQSGVVSSMTIYPTSHSNSPTLPPPKNANVGGGWNTKELLKWPTRHGILRRPNTLLDGYNLKVLSMPLLSDRHTFQVMYMACVKICAQRSGARKQQSDGVFAGQPSGAGHNRGCLYFSTVFLNFIPQQYFSTVFLGGIWAQWRLPQQKGNFWSSYHSCQTCRPAKSF